jgi:hypothetical protein
MCFRIKSVKAPCIGEIMQPKVHMVASANSATREGLRLAAACNFLSKIQFLFPYHPWLLVQTWTDIKTAMKYLETKAHIHQKLCAVPSAFIWWYKSTPFNTGYFRNIYTLQHWVLQKQTDHGKIGKERSFWPKGGLSNMMQSHTKQAAIWALTKNGKLLHSTTKQYVTPCNPLNPTVYYVQWAHKGLNPNTILINPPTIYATIEGEADV